MAECDAERFAEVKDFFERHDVDGSGGLDEDELAHLLEEQDLDFDAAELIAQCDKNGDGTLQLQELMCIFYPQNAPEAEADSDEEETEGLFDDDEFAGDDALGDKWMAAHGNEMSKLTWTRCPDFVKALNVGPAQLFAGIEPNDIMQGMVGDCWLMAALAAIAEFPGAVQSLFGTKKVSATGKYVVRLFDSDEGDFVEVEIDDKIACLDAGEGSFWGNKSRYTACFAKPAGGELWVILLEKAFAKFCGNYDNLEGGQSLFAWMVMTGCTDLWELRKDAAGEWTQIDVSYTDSRSTHSWAGAMGSCGEDGLLDEEEIWEQLTDWDTNNYLVGCSTAGGMEDQLDNGLVTGHAYSLISAKEVECDGTTHRMLCMRNPWGNDKEWNGDFSDKWAGWSKYPELKAELDVQQKDDGLFWMSFADWQQAWTNCSVCRNAMPTPRGAASTMPHQGAFKRVKNWAGGPAPRAEAVAAQGGAKLPKTRAGGCACS